MPTCLSFRSLIPFSNVIEPRLSSHLRPGTGSSSQSSARVFRQRSRLQYSGLLTANPFKFATWPESYPQSVLRNVHSLFGVRERHGIPSKQPWKHDDVADAETNGHSATQAWDPFAADSSQRTKLTSFPTVDEISRTRRRQNAMKDLRRRPKIITLQFSPLAVQKPAQVTPDHNSPSLAYNQGSRKVDGDVADSPAGLKNQVECHSRLSDVMHFSSSWTSRFQQLYNKEKVDDFRMSIDLLVKNVETLITSQTSLDQARQAWSHFSTDGGITKDEAWEDLMLWCLFNAPKHALRFLLATMRSSQDEPAEYKVGDSLEYLSRYFYHRKHALDTSAVSAISSVVSNFIKDRGNGISRPIYLPDRTAYLILKSGNARSFVEELVKSRASVNPNTLLHILQISLGWNDLPMSLEILKRVADSSFDLTLPQVQAACIALIRARHAQENQYLGQMRVLGEILEMGIRPQTAMYNAALLNAAEGGDHATAWKMFDLAKENGIKPDFVTYMIMLRNADLSGDPEAMERAVREAQSRPSVISGNPKLVGAVLTTLTRYSKLCKVPAFPSLVSCYKRYYDLQPLQQLGIVRSNTDMLSSQSHNKPSPTPQLIGQMLCARLMMKSGHHQVSEIYDIFHDFVLSNHPLIAPITQWDYVANSFIMTFSRRRRDMQKCATVIKHMLEATSGDRSQTSEVFSNSSKTTNRPRDLRPAFPRAEPVSTSWKDYAQFSPSPPTVTSWSLLARAYFRRHDKAAAEKVLKMMRDRGLRPNNVTWNFIIDGYARLQDIEGAVDAIERMQDDDHPITMQTYDGLSRIWDQKALLVALRAVVKEDSDTKEDRWGRAARHEGEREPVQNTSKVFDFGATQQESHTAKHDLRQAEIG